MLYYAIIAVVSLMQGDMQALIFCFFCIKTKERVIRVANPAYGRQAKQTLFAGK
jgi:hypothetical protein